MLGDFAVVLAWGVPGVAMMLAGQVVVFVTCFRQRRSFLVGGRLTAVGFAVATLGWLAAVSVEAFAMGLWPVGLFLIVNALLFLWLASRVRIGA
jgi:uncharacterized membrane protein